MTLTHPLPLFMRVALAAVALALVAVAAPVEAQSSSAVRAIQRYGQTNRRTAQRIGRSVHEVLVANGRRGGTEYDPVRQILGTAMYGGPGASRSEYDQRMAGVLDALRSGLTDTTLRAFFTPGNGVALRCATLFRVPMPSCDALISAAAQQPSDFPYLAPDDGSELRNEMSTHGVSGGQAREIVEGMRNVMLAVPSSVDSSSTGRTLGNLLRACPGGLDDRETQVRIWHSGPTVGVARCIVRALGRAGRNAPRAISQVFGISEPAAVSFLQWAHGQSVGTGPAAPAGPSRNQLMAQAQQMYQARRYADAARIYAQVTTMEPGFSPAHQGLAVSRMRSGDPGGAATAYRTAARLEPRNAGIQVGLARALTQTGDRQGASAAYQMALALEPRHPTAGRELAALSPQPRPQPQPQQYAQPQQQYAQPQPQQYAQPQPQPQVNPAVALRQSARANFQQRQFARAAADYTRLTQMNPTDAAAWAGLGASHFAQRNAAGAAEAYQIAAQLDANNPNFAAALGAAEAARGNTDAARAAFGRALQINPNHPQAQQGMSQLGPTLPATPARADIVREMGRFQDRIEACGPNISGRVSFRIIINGVDGAVSSVEALGNVAGTPEGDCMAGHLNAARFPRFTRPTLSISYPFELEGPPAGSEPAPPPEESNPAADAPSVDHIVDGILDE